jgi:hypothetical protein
MSIVMIMLYLDNVSQTEYCLHCGTVTKIPDKAAYTLGEKVSLKAVAEPGYEFISWSGALSEKMNPAVIIMHSNNSITANFIAGPAANGSIFNGTICGK